VHRHERQKRTVTARTGCRPWRFPALSRVV